VGKGMCGGEIVIKPAEGAGFAAHENTIAGNTVLYGATGGRLFAAGRAGERFAVRNSGAQAVIEGTGDHCCEYMTDGVVVVLGPTGRNFGAGMSGGQAFVFDRQGAFPGMYNDDMVLIRRLGPSDDSNLLRELVMRHAELTGSAHAKEILAHWEQNIPYFWEVTPKPVETPQAGSTEPELAEAGD